MEKNGIICLVSMFPTEFWSVNCPKRCIFTILCWLQQKSIEAIYIYASESSHYTLSENAMVYRCLSHCLWELVIKIWKKMLIQQRYNKNSSTSYTNISKTVIHSLINNTIFWKCIASRFRCMYVNCFNRFLAEASTKLKKKMHFSRQLKDHNSEREYGN